MNRQEYVRAIKDVIYLSYCAVNGRTPSESRVKTMDLHNAYRAAKHHMLTAVCAMALESAGIAEHVFTQAKGKAIRKNAQMEIDRQMLFAQLEKKGIWYMPLKGSVLKDYYPAFGMRQMSDFDILFDSSRAQDVKNIMESFGFTTEHFGHGNHDVYFKPPVSNFEMHTGLFGTAHDEKIYEYYRNVKDRLIKDENNDFSYHFSPEDFYVYITAHEYKHYSAGGTGLRSVLDIYVYLTKFGDTLDMGYIETECEKLGIAEFERQSRSLALDLFSAEKLSEEDMEMLRYIVFSGTYGTTENRVRNKVNKYGGGYKGKVKFVLNRLFLPMSSIKSSYPFFYEHKVLLPVLFLYRLGRGFTVSRKQVWNEVRVLKDL